MESAKRYVASKIFPDKSEDAVAHLSRCLVSERDGENAAGADVLIAHKVAHAMCDDPCLAGAGTCEYKERPVSLFDGLALARIKGFENGTLSGYSHDENDTSVRVRGGRRSRAGFELR